MQTRESLLEPHREFIVDKSFHQENRETLLKELKKAHPDIPANSIILLKGDVTKKMHDSDTEIHPRQEANFWYLFGVGDYDLYGIIEIDTGKTTLVAPKIPAEYKIWMPIHDKEYFLQNHKLDQVVYTEEMEGTIKSINPATIYLSDGVNSDSGYSTDLPNFPYLQDYKVNKEILYHAMCECRVLKTQKEIELMRYIGRVSSDAHIRLMQNCRPGIKEHQLEALYHFHCHNVSGSRELGYTAIVGGGSNAATLHYVDNDKVLKDGDLVLCDLGFKYYGYDSDITTTFPVNGKFTDKQKEIYNAVLDANREVKNSIKPGVNWDDMHFLAERTIVKHLIKLGIVKDAPLEELEKKRIGGMFFPHGLGHFIGLNTHDVGGYLKGYPQRLKELGIKSLRTRRTLFPKMCVTIEPGCYFVETLAEAFKNDPEKKDYINWEKFEEYKHVGGVRIEDDVVVTETGIENFVDVPRTVEEIEACMAGKEWRKL